MDIRTHDIFVMAATIFGESRGTMQIDREDVAQVILNRLSGPAWMRQHRDNIPDDTIEAVCRDPYQFSCWNSNDPNFRKLVKLIGNPLSAMTNAPFLKSLEATLRAINGHVTNRVGASLHYHAKSIPFPVAWGNPVSPKYDNGFHVFYEGIK